MYCYHWITFFLALVRGIHFSLAASSAGNINRVIKGFHCHSLHKAFRLHCVQDHLISGVEIKMMNWTAACYITLLRRVRVYMWAACCRWPGRTCGNGMICNTFWLSWVVYNCFPNIETYTDRGEKRVRISNENCRRALPCRFGVRRPRIERQNDSGVVKTPNTLLLFPGHDWSNPTWRINCSTCTW